MTEDAKRLAGKIIQAHQNAIAELDVLRREYDDCVKALTACVAVIRIVGLRAKESVACPCCEVNEKECRGTKALALARPILEAMK